MNYRKIWERYNNACLIKNIHIHHIDGNRNNNNVSNLIPVTPKEHYNIHLSQEDYGSALYLAWNCLNLTKEEKSYLSSMTMKKTHTEYKKIYGEEKYSEWQRNRSKNKKRSNKQKQNYVNGAKKDYQMLNLLKN